MAKKKRKRNGAKVFFVFLVISFLIIAVLSVTVLFPIKSVSVSGKGVYTQEEIINASGITLGHNILIVSEKGVSSLLSKSLPYIKKAEIKRSLTGEIDLKVYPEQKKYYTEHNGGYIIIGESRKVLENTPKKAKKLTKIIGVNEFTYEVGAPFTIKDETKNACFIELTDLAKKHKLNLSVIDLENISDLTLKIDNRLVVKLGTTVNLEQKFAHLNEMLEGIPESKEGIIDLKTWSIDKAEGYFRQGDTSKYFK